MTCSKHRAVWLLALATLAGGTGATCIIDNTTRDMPVGSTFAVAVSKPSTSRTVARGTRVDIGWSLTNKTGQSATVIILVEARIGPTRTELTRLTIDSTATRGDFTWDTTSFGSGDYAVVVRAETSSQEDEAGSLGRILVDEPPTFEFTAPAETSAVPIGGKVAIGWTAADAEADGTVNLFLDADLEHDSGNEIQILKDRRLPGARGNDAFDFTGKDATDKDVPFGTYSLFARVKDAANAEFIVEADAQIITANSAPTLTFTKPSEAVNATAGDVVSAAWSTGDAEGDAVFVTLQFDNDNTNDAADTTPPTVLVTRQQAVNGAGSFEWNTAGVAAGSWRLQALVTDDHSDAVFVAAGFDVTISKAAPLVTFTAPTANEDFLTSEPTLRISFNVKDPDNDVLVDVKIDADDNHANGNEITILSQRLVSKGTTDQDFDWTGTNSAGQAVADGIYTLFSVSSDGENTPVTNVNSTLIFRRSVADEPLIALLEPAANVTSSPGAFVNIKWRDEDPGTAATIRLTIDDDATPNETTETGDAELEILGGRGASTDGILDQFAYQIGALDPGTYYFFATITSGANSQASTAQGKLIIPNPAGGNP